MVTVQVVQVWVSSARAMQMVSQCIEITAPDSTFISLLGSHLKE